MEKKYLVIENEVHDEERSFYGLDGVHVKNSRIDGPADGESAFKECRNVITEGCFFNLRYPFWHDTVLTIKDAEMTEKCRASLWYSDHVDIINTKMHGIKALRECHDICIEDTDIISPEFGWSVNGLDIKNSTAESEYFMMRSSNLHFENVKFKGKYSFQYVDHAEIENCDFDTKDAFWHSSHVTVRNSIVKGEYLAWYSDHLTLIDCTIIGTQPLCYCTNLKLINCKMIDTDLAFERSDVEADIITPIDSIKNPHRGYIRVPAAGEVILDEPVAMTGICDIKIG